jgi:hypothetical protein
MTKENEDEMADQNGILRLILIGQERKKENLKNDIVDTFLGAVRQFEFSGYLREIGDIILWRVDQSEIICQTMLDPVKFPVEYSRSVWNALKRFNGA